MADTDEDPRFLFHSNLTEPRPSGSLDVLADMGGDENLFQMRHFLVGAGANEVDTALKQLSSSGSLIRNVRLNG
jgi:hypothetical protein